MSRCKLPSNVAHKDLTIEIIEEKKREGTYDAALPLISYVLPWKDRTTGYITFRPESSTLDPWRETKDDIHMYVGGACRLDLEILTKTDGSCGTENGGPA